MVPSGTSSDPDVGLVTMFQPAARPACAGCNPPAVRNRPAETRAEAARTDSTVVRRRRPARTRADKDATGSMSKCWHGPVAPGWIHSGGDAAQRCDSDVHSHPGCARPGPDRRSVGGVRWPAGSPDHRARSNGSEQGDPAMTDTTKPWWCCSTWTRPSSTPADRGRGAGKRLSRSSTASPLTSGPIPRRARPTRRWPGRRSRRPRPRSQR